MTVPGSPIARLISKKVELADGLKARFEVRRGFKARIAVTNDGQHVDWHLWDGKTATNLDPVREQLAAMPTARARLWITHPAVPHSDDLPQADVTNLIKEIARGA